MLQEIIPTRQIATEPRRAGALALGAAPWMAAAADEAQRHLDTLVADGETPGVQYLFPSADAVLYAYAGGPANLPERVPVSDRTTFNDYSVTKRFTAAAILQLAEQGRLDLDRPIREYLDRVP